MSLESGQEVLEGGISVCQSARGGLQSQECLTPSAVRRAHEAGLPRTAAQLAICFI